MAKITQNVSTAKNVLPPATPPAPVARPVPPAAPGSAQSSAKATTAAPKVHATNFAPSAGASSQSYMITANDIGLVAFQFGGHYYHLMDSLGRALDAADVGHVLTESYTPDGWVLTLN